MKTIGKSELKILRTHKRCVWYEESSTFPQWESSLNRYVSRNGKPCGSRLRCNTKIMTGALSPTNKGLHGTNEKTLQPPNRTVMDAFNQTSYYTKEPEIGFGTGSRPPLNNPSLGPGPGAYPIKTTMGKLMESHIQSPSQFTLRGRTKFGDPNEKTMSKSSASEPG